MKKYKMYVVTHKKFNYNLPDDYIPIQVGKCNTHSELPYITDETGDNISSKNSNYCELTAVYWIWKNIHDVEYVGISHYRRYFVYGITSKLVDTDYIKCQLEDKKYDVILPYEYKTESTVYNHFVNSTSGREKDLINLKNVIEKLFPDYLKTYDDVMSSKTASYCNMMISSKKTFDDYCEWLFKILFELEKITDMTGYTKQEQRLYGFLSEFLLNVWVRKNNLKIKHCNMYYIEDDKFKNLLKKLKLATRSVIRK